MYKSRAPGPQIVAVITLLCIAPLPTSCRTRTRTVPFTPAATPTLSVEQAKRVIYRSLEEQPVGQVVNVEITDKTLSFSPTTRGRSVSARRTVFYFDSLGKMNTTPKKSGQVVRVWDRNGVYRFRVIIPNPDRARRFMDSLHVMSLQAKSQARQ